jgi:hypothetical protein
MLSNRKRHGFFRPICTLHESDGHHFKQLSSTVRPTGVGDQLSRTHSDEKNPEAVDIVAAPSQKARDSEPNLRRVRSPSPRLGPTSLAQSHSSFLPYWRCVMRHNDEFDNLPCFETTSKRRKGISLRNPGAPWSAHHTR